MCIRDSYQYCALNLKSGFGCHHQRTGDTAVASRCSPLYPSNGRKHCAARASRHAIMRPGLQLVTCPTDSGYRDRIFLPIGSLALLEGTALDPYGRDPSLPKALCVFFLSGDAHESMSVTSVSDDARLAVRSLDDEWGERRRVLAKGGDSEVLGFGDFVVRASFLLCRIPTDDTRHYAGVRV